jgi:hypothetical protein
MTNQNKVKSFILYQEYKKNISLLSQNQKGDLLDAIFSFNEEVEIKLDPIVEMAFSFIKSDLERNKIKYQNIIERNKINGVNGGRPKNPKEPKKPSGLFGNPKEPKETLNDNEDDNEDKDDNKNEECKLINDNLDEIKKNEIDLEKPKTKKFIKPSIQEIKDYCFERKNSVDAEKFFDYYEARAWKEIKNWQACVRTWEKNGYSSNSKPQTGYRDPYSYNPNNYKHLLNN